MPGELGRHPPPIHATGDQPLDPPGLGPRRPAKRRLTLTVTPLGAFAAGALMVAALVLAWTVGRRMPLESPPRTYENTDSLDDVRRMPPIPYNQLPVDRGFADGLDSESNP